MSVIRRLSLIAVSSFAVGVLSGIPAYSVEENILYDAVVKLIMKYDELIERVRNLEKRVSTLENSVPVEEMEIDTRKLGRIRTWVNLRSGPDKKYPRILVLRPGEEVEILEESGEWYKVKTKEGFIGYSHSYYVVEVRK